MVTPEAYNRILLALLTGKDNKEIANELRVGIGTVEEALAQAKQRAGTSNRAVIALKFLKDCPPELVSQVATHLNLVSFRQQTARLGSGYQRLLAALVGHPKKSLDELTPIVGLSKETMQTYIGRLGIGLIPPTGRRVRVYLTVLQWLATHTE